MNMKDVQKYMKENGIDAWVLYDFQGMNSIAQFIAGTKDKAITRRYFYFIFSNGKISALVHSVERSKFQHIEGNVVGYSSLKDMVGSLKEILKSSNIIAMEYSPLCATPYVSKVDAGILELLRSVKKGIEIVSSADMIQLTKSRWEDAGYKLHMDASKKIDAIKDQTFKLICDKVKSKEIITEYDVQQFVIRRFNEENIITIYEPVIAVNKNSSDPHYMPTKEMNKPIKEGDIIIVDLDGKMNEDGAVFADMTWVGYVGKSVPVKYKRIFDIVAEARDAVVDSLTRAYSQKKVLEGWQLDDVARNIIRKSGYEKNFLHRTGHSIDTEIHGSGVCLDNFETRDVRKIIKGVGFSVEPGIYLDEFGIRSEIDVYIGEKGPEVTTKIQRAIIPILTL
jgi:Xaa-Pro dipeptidase